ncbi:MAG: glycerol-3-phosphate acyltransferase [Chloroflexi bacterium]|nr:glycerol-3-phosphate acyltransferase [Chloroflexota bacterium]MDA1240932.1 glycerol-3-phosphate acyltransferase [Chloroflexota bacterium]
MTYLTVMAVAYLLGAIPTSYLVVYLVTGRDIRSLGNGNPGMMNVWDNVGLKPALVVALGDVGKGMAAVGFAYWMGLGDGMAVLAAFAAVLGHDYSIFLRFDGGNGTAATVGAMIALVPAATLPALAVAAIIVTIKRSKRIAGVIGLLLVPTLAAFQSYPLIIVAGVIGLLLIVAIKIVRFEGFTPVRSRPPR